jgi:hypothetical protein
MVTKSDDAKRLATLAKLVPIMREEIEKLSAMVEEFDSLTGGKATVGEKIRECESHWSELWASAHGEPWVWSDYAKSRGNLKALFRKGLSVAQFKSRVSIYITGPNKYYADRKHPWGLFIQTINEHVREGGDSDLAEVPTGCKHNPPCRDQFAHTKRRQAELTS